MYYFSTLFSLTLVLICLNFGEISSEFNVKLVKNANKFANDIYKAMTEGTNDNIVVSPFAIRTGLSLIAMGATGRTADDLFNSLRESNSNDKRLIAESYASVLNDLKKENILKIANKIYLQQNNSYFPKFQELAELYFDSRVDLLDFKKNFDSAKVINDWVEVETNHKIQNLIQPGDLDSASRMVIVNVVYFKGNWVNAFDPEKTRPAPFWISATESIDVPMMFTKQHFNFGFDDEMNARIIELHYENSDLTMLIILPNEREGWKNLASKLDKIDIEILRTKLFEFQIDLYLPKFKIESSFDLQRTLETLGMGNIFSNKAEFNELLEHNNNIHVSKIIHKAFIEINEEGTEAAGAGGHLIDIRCESPPVYVDRPFYYFIRSPDNHILFMGQKIHF